MQRKEMIHLIKSKKGFTLVELIVVIAILAIIAGMAIPAYSNYIKKAQDTAILTELDAIQTAAQAANATFGRIEIISVSADGNGQGTTISVCGSPVTDENGDPVLDENGKQKYELAPSFNSDFCMFYNNAEPVSADSVGVFALKKPLKFNGTSFADGAHWSYGEDVWNSGTEDVPDQDIGDIGGSTPVNPAPPSEDDETEEPVHTHSYRETRILPTCKEGYIVYTCTGEDCEESYTIKLDPVEHIDRNNDDKCDGCGIDLESDEDWTLPTG